MVQVLPAVPTFGEKLANQLSKTGSDIGKALQQRNAKTQLQALLNPQAQTTTQGTQGAVGISDTTGTEQPSPSKLSAAKVVQLYNLAEKAYGKEGAKKLVDTIIQQDKLAEKEAAEIRKEERQLAQAGTQDYFKKIEEDRIKLPQEEFASEMVMDAINSGDLDPWSKAHIADIAKGLGVPESITKFLETPGSKEFKTGMKTFIGHTVKENFRGMTTKPELRLAEEMNAEIGVTRAGNLAAIWGLNTAIEIKRERLRLTDELKEQGVSPSKIPATVDKKMKPFVQKLHDEYFEALRYLREKESGE